MMNNNFWKDAYKELWADSSEKEDYIKDIVERETGFELVPFGFGAESTEFLSGSAEEYGKEKGAPDFKVKGTNIFVEVTGPLSEYAKPYSGLWLRPDKLNYAQKYKMEHDEFFVLYFASINKWFSIHADQEFIKEAHSFEVIRPVIRGNKERYIVVPYNHKSVKPLSYMIGYIKNI